MIRLIQRKLIIPRGDTGSFTIPAITAASNGDVAIFTIFDYKTHSKLFEKMVEVNSDAITFDFTHNETVNLLPGQYFWDVKFYREPVFADGELINGTEIDSYYAGFKLPECEIRETGDNLLISSEAPTATLSPTQLNIISSALSEVAAAVAQTQVNVEHYPVVGIDGHWYNWDASTNTVVDTGISAVGDTGTGIQSITKTATEGLIDTYTILFTDNTSTTFTVRNGEDGNPGIYYGAEEPTDPEADIWINPEGTPIGVVRYDTEQNLSGTEKTRALENIGATHKVSNAVNGDFAALDSNGNLVDSGHKHSDYLTSFTETDPTVPAWAKEANKPTYTASEVGLGNVANERQYSANNPPPSDDTKQDLIIANGLLKGDGNGGIVAAVAGTDYIATHQDISGKLDTTLKGTANGLAELNESGKVPSSQLPSYVDDVLEYDRLNAFPFPGESGKIYVAKDTNITYRWGGSEYVEISASLALGEISSTAYRGDRGKTAYDHATAKGSAFASGLYKITTNSEGHVTAAAEVQKSDITGLGIPVQDTTYESKSAVSEGTDVSLVTTGEKYNWNNKYDKPVNGIPASDLDAEVIDTTLTVSGKVADAKVTGDKITDLKSAIVQNYADTIKIKQGYWAIADGSAVNSQTWCRTNKYVYKDLIVQTTTCDMWLVAYNKLTEEYIGTWDGSAFSTTYVSSLSIKKFDISDYVSNYPNYIFAIDFKASGTLTPSDVYSDLIITSKNYENYTKLNSNAFQRCAIPAVRAGATNPNLNDCEYGLTVLNASDTYDNIPEGVGNVSKHIITYYNMTGQYKIQYLFADTATSDIYRRIFNGTWSAWTKLFSTGALHAQITPSNDLNDLMDTGVYGFGWSTSLSNAPTGIGNGYRYVSVYKPSNGVTYQEIINNTTGNGWVRTRHDNTVWDNWVQTNAPLNTKVDELKSALIVLANAHKNDWATVAGIVRSGLGANAYPVGTQFIAPHTVYGDVVFVVMGHDHHADATGQHAHTMTLAVRDGIPGIEADATEALYYAEEGLAAGTYHFTLPQNYDVAHGGGKTLQFTLSQAVPADGIIMFPWANNTESTDIKVSTYASRADTTAIESNIAVSEGSGGIDLGTADGTGVNINNVRRVRAGSNNWAESADRQWINSAAAAGEWWTPQTCFDRIPAYASDAGFLAGFDAEFLDVLGEVDNVTARNTVYEYGGTTGGSYVTRDKMFNLSMAEVGLGANNNISEGTLLPYYTDATDAKRVKYNIVSSTTTIRWWLRSPYTNNPCDAYAVTTAGALNSYNANAARGLAPACIIC